MPTPRFWGFQGGDRGFQYPPIRPPLDWGVGLGSNWGPIGVQSGSIRDPNPVNRDPNPGNRDPPFLGGVGGVGLGVIWGGQKRGSQKVPFFDFLSKTPNASFRTAGQKKRKNCVFRVFSFGSQVGLKDKVRGIF